MSDKKITVMTISDHPLLPSGVGIQTKYIIEALLKTGKFRVLSLGGAIEHATYEPSQTEEWGEDWTIFPIKGYGDQQKIRQFLLQFKPDILYFMTDPRFYEWLWHMEDEIRTNVPMIYYHVWDNYPYPVFNNKYYSSNDKIATISKVTSDIVQTVSPQVDEEYIPHAVNTNIFKKFISTADTARVQEIKKQFNFEGKTVFFWNNRNARRKQSGSLTWWFKDFLDIVGHDKAVLLMHPEVDDPHGQPLNYIAQIAGMVDGQVQFSVEKVAMEDMAVLYNVADVTINISDAEGFGLATLESLACETPIIVNMTGGLQEQVTDGENWFGVGLEPVSKAVIGSQQVPFIFEDRLSKEQVVDGPCQTSQDEPGRESGIRKIGTQTCRDELQLRRI